MSQKAPAFAGSIASFESEGSEVSSDAGSLPSQPLSPIPSESASELEAETELRLGGALAAGAVVGLPGGKVLQPAPTEAEL